MSKDLHGVKMRLRVYSLIVMLEVMLKKLCQGIMLHSLIIYLCILGKCKSDNGMAICQLSCPSVSTLLFSDGEGNEDTIPETLPMFVSIHIVIFQSMKQLTRKLIFNP